MSQPTIVLFGLPNDFILCVAVVIATFVCGALIKTLYGTTTKRAEYPTITHRVSVRGIKLLRMLAALCVPIVLMLFDRVTIENKSEFWSTPALMEGHWAIIRIWCSFVILMALMLFDASPVFRICAIIGVSMLATIDMLSQRAYVDKINCIDRGICSNIDNKYVTAHVFGVRDGVSLFYMLILIMYTLWLCSLFGFCSNDVYLPRKEHRMLSRRMAVQRSEDPGFGSALSTTNNNKRRKKV